MSEAGKSMSSGQYPVLFVDDEPAVLETYQRLLHRDYEIEIAVGAEAALRMLKVRGP